MTGVTISSASCETTYEKIGTVNMLKNAKILPIYGICGFNPASFKSYGITTDNKITGGNVDQFYVIPQNIDLAKLS